MEIDLLLNSPDNQDVIKRLRIGASCEQHLFLDTAAKVAEEMEGIGECCEELERAVQSRLNRA